MKDLNKKIIIASITLVLFLISFILFHNDLINYFIISVTGTVIMFIYLCIVVFVKKKVKNEYDRNLKKILRTYDSLLIYSNTDYEINEKNITLVKNINDLTRYCDELNKTIIYIEEADSSSFLMKVDNELLVYIMKRDEYSRSIIEDKIHTHLRDLES